MAAPTSKAHSQPYQLKKSLGQHFLHDEHMCQKVVQQITRHPGLNLLEVGPGGGALTKYLLQWPDTQYKAIEIDTEKVVYLQSNLPLIAGKLINEDILRAAIPFEAPFSLVGNFPYNISSQILFKVLEWEPSVTEAVGMFQKEVAQRIASGPGSKVYGILSVLMQAFFKVEYLFDVPPQCFTPPPKVVSGVLRFTNLNNPHGITHMRSFTNLVKAGFNQRRKTLRNALRGTLPPTAMEDPMLDKRAEQLSVADFVYLYKQYLNK